MGRVVGWFGELTVKRGELARLAVLTREMVASAKNETGVVLYERYITADGMTLHLHERFADSAAALGHLQLFHALRRAVHAHGRATPHPGLRRA